MQQEIYCRFIFREFTNDQILNFQQLCLDYQFYSIDQFQLGQSAHYGHSKDGVAERDETQFSFILRDSGEKERDRKYQLLSLAFAELTTTFETFRHEVRPSQRATVSFTILSKEIFPKYFALQHSFGVDKFQFGSIINNRYFAPTYRVDESNSQQDHEILKGFLNEQKDIPDTNANCIMICEHDRQCVSICFPDVMKESAKIKEHHSRKRVVELKLPFTGIRRLIVNLKADEDIIRATFIFQFNFVPSIYIHEKVDQPYSSHGNHNIYFKPPSRYFSWNLGQPIESSLKVASCVCVETKFIDTRELLDSLDRFRKTLGQPVDFRYLDRLKKATLNEYYRNFFMHSDQLPTALDKYLDPRYFPLVYAVQAITSRGGEIYDYFFRPCFNQFHGFLEMVTTRFDYDLTNDPDAQVARTVVALEHMLQQLDRLCDIPDPFDLFEQIYNDSSLATLAEVTADLREKGYVRVRKILITPSRKIYLNPELIMGNRSLRKTGADNMLRVVFRDDNGMKLSGLPKPILDKTVTNTLTFPMNVGFVPFTYVSSSNSQLRDHGCYFLQGTPEDVKKFIADCGTFKVEQVSKMMSRIAQCFTQARQSGVRIKRKAYSEVFDYTGSHDSNGKPYTFSDGCGVISQEFASKIVTDLNLGDCKPSCFQIRFRGYKGIVTVNSYIDEVREWAKIHKPSTLDVSPKEPLPWFGQSLLFRPSQKKFHGPPERVIEIVKISAPIPVSLNKPLINILDQVSEMHGKESHKRMCERIFDLLENDITKVISGLVDEPQAFLTLNEFPKYIMYDKLRDFNITEEPFFRSLLRSSALVSLNQLVDKMQIRIPLSQGRMAFGVVDETGLLQYGQVFFQYTVNANIKWPSPNADKKVHTGPLMVTKNPSVVSGDVRMFEAVDLPCLHDLVDVIVFPQSGPRPHPDEMAGSDLDGDEYSIFWDPMLFLDRNEPAFDFTPDKTNDFIDEEDIANNFSSKMIEFFVKYISQDSIGAIANAHLANSDLYGINSELCRNIAIKHNKAIDFPKSGQVPDTLIPRWTTDKYLPPEKVERYPDFMAKSSQASYKSVRLLGDLYERVTEIREIIRIEDLVASNEEVMIDNTFLVTGYEAYITVAEKIYNRYCASISGILETYGIQSEGQLFSGRFSVLKKQLTDKENENFDMFNTQHMIEEQVAEIYSRFRIEFFEDFGGIEENTEFDSHNSNGNREVFRRICTMPKLELRKKAAAFYYVAYKTPIFLSFPWIASDILAFNRKQYFLQPGKQRFSLYPLQDHLSQFIDDTCSSPQFKDRYENFCAEIAETIESGEESSESMANLTQHFIGLQKIIFFNRLWAEKHQIEIDFESLDALFIKFGMGDFHQGGGGWLTYFDDETVIDLESQLGGIGKRFWDFQLFAMTRTFGNMDEVQFRTTNNKIFKHQCTDIHYAAMDTFYSIAVNRRFENLPGSVEFELRKNKVSEGGLFVIEIPRYGVDDYAKLCATVAKKCGLKYCSFRKKRDLVNDKSFRLGVKPVGTFVSIRRFRNLLEVSPRYSQSDLHKRSIGIAKETYARIQFYAQHDINDAFVM